VSVLGNRGKKVEKPSWQDSRLRGRWDAFRILHNNKGRENLGYEDESYSKLSPGLLTPRTSS
jgi:hypothetical protein